MTSDGHTPGRLAADPELEPYRDQLQRRRECYRQRLQHIEASVGSLAHMATGHHYFGFNRGQCEGTAGICYREWAPGADALALVGDFNDWDRHSHTMTRDPFGVWSIFLPDTTDGQPQLTHGSAVMVHVRSSSGAEDRIPAYMQWVVRSGRGTYTGRYHNGPGYTWKHPTPKAPSDRLRIYEAHVGMAQEKEGIGTWREFTETILPRVVAGGYTADHLMAVTQHPAYDTLRYQVERLTEERELQPVSHEAWNLMTHQDRMFAECSA